MGANPVLGPLWRERRDLGVEASSIPEVGSRDVCAL